MRSFVNGCTKQQAVAVIANPPAPYNVSWQHLKHCSVGYSGCYADLNRFNEQLWSHYWKPVFREEVCHVAVQLWTLQIRTEIHWNFQYVLNTKMGKKMHWTPLNIRLYFNILYSSHNFCNATCKYLCILVGSSVQFEIRNHSLKLSPILFFLMKNFYGLSRNYHFPISSVIILPFISGRLWCR